MKLGRSCDISEGYHMTVFSRIRAIDGSVSSWICNLVDYVPMQPLLPLGIPIGLPLMSLSPHVILFWLVLAETRASSIWRSGGWRQVDGDGAGGDLVGILYCRAWVGVLLGLEIVGLLTCISPFCLASLLSQERKSCIVSNATKKEKN